MLFVGQRNITPDIKKMYPLLTYLKGKNVKYCQMLQSFTKNSLFTILQEFEIASKPENIRSALRSTSRSPDLSLECFKPHKTRFREKHCVPAIVSAQNRINCLCGTISWLLSAVK